ncbi:MAG: metal ABC transporter solute-binding protein, Zn/Mn family [Marinifilaceae bacterium]
MKRILLPFMVLCLAVCMSCNTKQTVNNQVTVSILPIEDIVKQISGDKLDINVLIPQGANHSNCDFTMQQLARLQQSKLCFTIGNLTFERAQLFPMLTERKQAGVVHLAEGCKLVESSCSCGHAHDDHDTHAISAGTDPHIWMSPRFMLKMSERVYTELCQHFPEHKDEFAANYEVLSTQITQLDSMATNKLANKSGKSFIIYHPALTYFASDYGLEQISIEQDGKEPSPAVLREVIDHAKNKDVKLILIQNQFDIQNAQSVANATGCNVKTINPLTNNWIEEMTNLINLLAENL